MDFMLKFAASAPAYFKDAITFLGAPKTFLASRAEASESSDIWPHALSFFACSGLIAYALHAAFKFLPLAQNPNFNGFLITILMIGAGVFFLAVAAKVAWRAVGKSIAFERVLLIEIYIFAVAMVMGNILTVMMTGLGLILFPEAYLVIIKLANHHTYAEFNGIEMRSEILELTKGIPMSVFVQAAIYSKVVLAASVLTLITWALITWGAFRHLAKVPRWRSGIAVVVYLVLSSVIVLLFSLTLANIPRA